MINFGTGVFNDSTCRWTYYHDVAKRRVPDLGENPLQTKASIRPIFALRAQELHPGEPWLTRCDLMPEFARIREHEPHRGK